MAIALAALALLVCANFFQWRSNQPVVGWTIDLLIALAAGVAAWLYSNDAGRARRSSPDKDGISRDELSDLGVAWWCYRPAARSFQLSPAYQPLLGIRSAVSTWRAALDHVHPEDRSKLECLIQETIRGKRDHFQSYHRLIHKDGSVRHVVSIVRARAEGKQRSLLGLALRCSADAHGESEPVDRHAYLQHPAIGVWENVFSDPRQHGFSRQIFAMIGCEPVPANETMEFFFNRMHPDDVAGLRRAIDPVLAPFGSTTYCCVFRLRHAEGHWVRVMSLGYCLTRTEDGLCDRVCGLHIDLDHAEAGDTDRG